MENCENGGFTNVTGIVNHLEDQLHRGNLLQSHMREEQVQSFFKLIEEKIDVKFVSGTEGIGEHCCIIFVRKPGTGKPIQEFCFQNDDPSNLGRCPLEGNP